MCQTVSCPSWSRCSVAAIAPASESPETSEIPPSGPAWTRNDRQILRQLQQRVCGFGLRRDDEDALDPLDPQPLDGLEDRGAVERAHADGADEVALPVRGVVDAEERDGRAVEGRVEPDHAERPRAARRERPRHRVRPVLELLHGRQDAVPGLGRTCVLPLMTRETVWCETSASFATSAMTAGRRFFVAGVPFSLSTRLILASV